MKTTLEIRLDEIAAILCNRSNVKQAEFINYFASKLKEGCKGKIEGQVEYIAKRLDSDGKDFINSLAGFIKLGEINKR